MTIDPDAFDAFEAAGWERVAPSYDHFFGSLTGRAVEPLLDAAGVQAGSRLLDIATGPGYAASRARDRGAEVVGLDVAAAMVELARARNPTIRFVQGSATELPFPGESFDVVVGNFAMLHLGEPERGAAELARVLAPDGRVALSVWDAPERARVLGVLLEAIAAVGVTPPKDIPVGPHFFRFADEAEFRTLLTDASLGSVDVQTLEYEWPLQSPDELFFGILEGTVRTAALLRAANDEQRAAVKEALEERLAPYRSDAGYAVPVSVKIATATKPA